MTINPDIFKNYDIRGVIPDELDMAGVNRLAEAVVDYFKPKQVAIGRDVRNTSPEIFSLFKEVFLGAGVNVFDLGIVSTDMVYFASGKLDADLSIMITASHNPAEYNGFKMMTKGAKAVSGDTGFYPLRDLVLSAKKFNLSSKNKGKLTSVDIYQDWIDFCLSFVDLKKITPKKVVIDAGNGVAGKLFGHPYLNEKLPVEIIPLYFKPDGNFPNHLPNPLNQDNLTDIQNEINRRQADFGVVLDGDGDRIGFLSEKGEFLSGTATTALIAGELLKKYPGEMILYNAVCGRIVPETVKNAGGVSERVRVGHSLIKAEMRESNALFAGEHSCHYFYRDVYFAEASLVSFLSMIDYLSLNEVPFSTAVRQFNKYPRSGEINFQVNDKQVVIKGIEKNYHQKADTVDWLDGVSVWFKTWWANIRPSNTQPLLRLNVEADNSQVLNEKTEELISLIESLGGQKSSQ